MTKALTEIADEVRAWSARNFPDQRPVDPLEGLIEELGELAHARLKRRQGIRHTPEECEARERDAIGDMGIYLIDFANRAGMQPGEGRSKWGGGIASADMAGTFFLRLCFRVGLLAREFESDNRCFVETGVTSVAEGLYLYSSARGWDFPEILNETWDRVGKRDWQADPMTATE